MNVLAIGLGHVEFSRVLRLIIVVKRDPLVEFSRQLLIRLLCKALREECLELILFEGVSVAKDLEVVKAIANSSSPLVHRSLVSVTQAALLLRQVLVILHQKRVELDQLGDDAQMVSRFVETEVVKVILIFDTHGPWVV